MSAPGSRPELEPKAAICDALARNGVGGPEIQPLSDIAFVWAPPAPDPEYWENVARARDIRHSIARMKTQLAQAKREGDILRLGADIRALEHRLMKHIDRHILSYDDVIEPIMPGDHSRVLGTVSPPTSPSLAPNRPLPPTPAPRFASGALPPTPSAAPAAIAVLGSQALINSHKKSPDFKELASEEPPESSIAARKPAWASLFGSRSVRLADTAPPGDRMGLPSPVSPRRLHAA
ncbi:hypothetical protein IWW37_000879 [Coemansia sp. RSA 2050]|nr:hypothetical protein IWW37_000879 [Coemansia sp. RSA 2050]